jgi:2-polyprenyl-3-methyl-5-hydroxy-6-metoxy-1,4-benzoquinol methylase
MRYLDRVLQRWRSRVAERWVSTPGRVLDIGCADGAFLRRCAARGCSVVGLEPDLRTRVELDRGFLCPGYFPDDLPDSEPFDFITMLAVLEHVPPSGQRPLATACWNHMRPGGRVVITVPSPAVDSVLAVLGALRLVDGMSLEQHYGFDVNETPGIFEGAGFRLLARRRFQLGFNNVFVFERRA